MCFHNSSESPANTRDVDLIPGREAPLEMEMATHSSILAWKIPWTERPEMLLSMGSQSWTPLNNVAITSL